MAEQIQVAKGNIYAAVGPDGGISVSKSVVYAVVEPHTDIEVAKAVVYAIITFKALDYMPILSRLLIMQR